MILQNKPLAHTCNAKTALLIWFHEARETSAVKVSVMFFFSSWFYISLSQVPSNVQLHKERRHIWCHLHICNYITIVKKHGGGITEYWYYHHLSCWEARILPAQSCTLFTPQTPPETDSGCNYFLLDKGRDSEAVKRQSMALSISFLRPKPGEG